MFAHYAVAKYLLDETGIISRNQVEKQVKQACKDLLFTRDWKGKPWQFWIDGAIDEEERGELNHKIRASIILLLLLLPLIVTIAIWRTSHLAERGGRYCPGLLIQLPGAARRAQTQSQKKG